MGPPEPETESKAAIATGTIRLLDASADGTVGVDGPQRRRSFGPAFQAFDSETTRGHIHGVEEKRHRRA